VTVASVITTADIHISVFFINYFLLPQGRPGTGTAAFWPVLL
jgi:hypothetical protein